MAFIVEDGSGVVGANSYGTVAAFRAYHEDRGVSGVDSGTISDAAAQGLLVKATDYVDRVWGGRFIGLRRFTSLSARSRFTLSDLPLVGETVTIGGEVFTFRADETVAADVDIKTTVHEQLVAMALAMGEVAAESGSVPWSLAEVDANEPALVVYTTDSGVAVSTDASNGAWSAATTSGASPLRQPLEWPRRAAYDRDGLLIYGVPRQVREAVYEYALRANSAALLPDPTVSTVGQRVRRSRDRVGPIETEREYDGSSQLIQAYPVADRLLLEVTVAGGGRTMVN